MAPKDGKKVKKSEGKAEKKTRSKES